MYMLDQFQSLALKFVPVKRRVFGGGTCHFESVLGAAA
jgi:hypothetical protein